MHDSGEVVELRPNFRTAYAGLGAEDHYLARGCKQMWQHYLKPCSAALVMHTAETRLIQRVLNQVEKEEKLAPHIKHLLGGASTSPLKQGYLPKDTSNLVTCTESSLDP